MTALIGILGIGSAVALAAIFSGSVLSPLTSLPVAAATGLAVGWSLTRDY